MHKIILASKSKVRKKILDENNIECKVFPSNTDEELVKKSLIKENLSPELISKNLAECKANKISNKSVIRATVDLIWSVKLFELSIIDHSNPVRHG